VKYKIFFDKIIFFFIIEFLIDNSNIFCFFRERFEEKWWW